MAMDILRRFEGVVSLEVFSYEKLKASMKFLAGQLSDHPTKN
jgi:hypothetical protein